MDNTYPHQSAYINNLHRQWAIYLLFSLCFWLAGYGALRTYWQPLYALRWLIFSGLTLGYVLQTTYRALPYNHRKGEVELFQSLGIGNWLTFIRGWLIAALGGFLFSPLPQGWLGWMPGILYTLAGLTDFFDGYLARITRHATLTGEILDINLDGAGMLVAVLLLVQYGQVPVWYVLIALARYLFLAGIWLRERLGKPVYQLPYKFYRRMIAGWQMDLTFVLLFPVFSPPVTMIVATLFAIPFLGGFILDWLAVSGVLHLETLRFPKLEVFMTEWLPLVLRLMAAGLMIWHLLDVLHTIPSPVSYWLAVCEAVILLLLASGAAGRLAAVGGLFLIGIGTVYGIFTGQVVLLLVILSGMLYIGTGKYSLWKPEDKLIYRKAGEG